MELFDALQLIKELVVNPEKNRDYKHVTELADKYRKLITGNDIGSLLIQFVQREEKALFDQRVRFTKTVTPAVAASVRKPFNKVARAERIRKSWEMSNARRTENVGRMISSFYGAAKKQNRGLDYWLKTRFLSLQFSDPNAWLVIEWEQTNDQAAVILPRPFEVSAHEATNWQIINDEIKWLQVTQDITYLTLASMSPDEKPIKKAGKRFTLYDEDITIKYEQCDSKYLARIGYQLQRNQSIEKIKEDEFLVQINYPKLGYAPAFRIGYVIDEATKGRTFVNPWHDALCYFEKSLKTVSEFDLTMGLHVFPQKSQYVKKCMGAKRGDRLQVCKAGRLADGGVCPTCKGEGYQIHTSAQDVINVPMPDDPKDMIPLDNLVSYKAPPIETVKFQNEYIQQLEKQVHQAVFNSQVFVKTQYTATSQPETATATDYNMESVYDTLEPFTEKWSELWLDIVTTFGIIAGESIENIKAVHVFPADPKLKNSGILMAERKSAMDAGAPSFMVSTIDDNLADINYAGDDLALNKYYIKRRYQPFPGKGPDEIALLLSSQYVPKFYKVLYSNFDEIFKEVENKNPEIWTDYASAAKFDKIVADKVQEFIDRLDAAAPVFSLDNMRAANPATATA